MDYLAKKVVELESGKQIGFVLDYAIDFQKFCLKGFYVVDEETQGEYLLKLEDIQSVGDVVLILDVTKIEFVPAREKNLIGKEVLSEQGFSLGFVDMLIFDKSKLKSVCTQICEIPIKIIDFVGEDCLFLKGRRKTRKIKNVFSPILEEPKVVAMLNVNEKITPEKVNLSFSYFAGKLATCDVFGYNNERIVLKNEKITKIIFENAKKHNKLNELFFALKK